MVSKGCIVPGVPNVLTMGLCLMLTLFAGSCAKDDAPVEPIQPSDEGAVDPNAAALPAELGGDPVDPATAPGDIPNSSEIPGDTAADDAVDAPLGTLTEDPWAAPGEPADLKDGAGTVKGEDLGTSAAADTGGIPSMGEDTSAPPAGSTDGLGYTTAKKKGKTPKVAADSTGKKKKEKKKKTKQEPKVAGPKKSKSKGAAAMAAGSAETTATPSASGTGNSVRYVTAIQLNIRSAPDRKSSVVRRIKGGDEVSVTIDGPWAKLGEGEYIRTKYLSKSPQRAVTEAEIEAAWAKRGKKKPASTTKNVSKKKSGKSKSKKASPSSVPAGDLNGETTGETALPPDPGAAPAEESIDDQLDGDQDPQ